MIEPHHNKAKNSRLYFSDKIRLSISFIIASHEQYGVPTLTCLFNSQLELTKNPTSKLRVSVTALCWGNCLMADGFPSQRSAMRKAVLRYDVNIRMEHRHNSAENTLIKYCVIQVKFMIHRTFVL